MEKWSWFGFLMLAATVSAKGVLDLSGKEEVNGTWKASVVLPCAYEPSPDFRELSVAWKASQQEHGFRTLFHRDQSSGDQTLLTAFKGRLSVRRQPAGDVSLQIEVLDMTDSGIYTCSVAWEAKNKSRITKERVTRLRVIKVPVTKPLIKSSFGAGTVLSEGAQATLSCLTEGSPPIKYRWFKKEADSPRQFVDSGAVLTFDSLKASDAGRYSCVVGNRVNTRMEWSETFELIVRNGSTHFSTIPPTLLSEEPITSRPETTKKTFEARTTMGPIIRRRATTAKAARTSSSTFGLHGKVSERQGHRKAALPLYVIILIAVLAAAVVLAAIAIAFCRRRTKSDRSYPVAYNNNTADFVPGAGGGQGPAVDPQPWEGPYEEPNRCLENNYTEEPTKAGLYVAMHTQPESEYELLVSKESEYEVTV
ncbi:V-set and immunoglobulin domain-containing protein 4 [Anolis sagrei]|uniref:V-set and immunoglobulin domain-containing protein 4 n=1 Tax=Anolis sagrei TaxID=38937 RepID=UPI0035206F27